LRSYTFDALNRPTAVANAAGVSGHAYLHGLRLSKTHYFNSTATRQMDDSPPIPPAGWKR
jgi:hypothetical protein